VSSEFVSPKKKKKKKKKKKRNLQGHVKGGLFCPTLCTWPLSPCIKEGASFLHAARGRKDGEPLSPTPARACTCTRSADRVIILGVQAT
jgi:hypothetical protein